MSVGRVDVVVCATCENRKVVWDSMMMAGMDDRDGSLSKSQMNRHRSWSLPRLRTGAETLKMAQILRGIACGWSLKRMVKNYDNVNTPIYLTMRKLHDEVRRDLHVLAPGSIQPPAMTVLHQNGHDIHKLQEGHLVVISITTWRFWRMLTPSISRIQAMDPSVEEWSLKAWGTRFCGHMLLVWGAWSYCRHTAEFLFHCADWFELLSLQFNDPVFNYKTIFR